MAGFAKFEDIEAWKAARRLTVKIYLLTKSGEFSRDYGLVDQIRRATISISSNIAEGFERKTPKSFVQFLLIAKGSAGEVRSQLYAALDLGYLTQEQFDDALASVARVSKMLVSLINYLDSQVNSQSYRTKNQEPGTKNQEPKCE